VSVYTSRKTQEVYRLQRRGQKDDEIKKEQKDKRTIKMSTFSSCPTKQEAEKKKNAAESIVQTNSV
jgi:hypothetical protein